MATRYCCALIFILLFMLDLSECRRGGGGSSKRVPTRSPSRRTTTYRSPQRATTPSYNLQTQQAYPNYNQPSYNRPNAAQKATTPRYNIQTQQAYPSNSQPGYNQPGYNQPGYNQPHYNQPGYNQPHYNQPGYNQPHYNQPGYNQPHYNQPGYNQPHYNQPGYGQSGYLPGGWPQKSDHSVRNSVLAGLGGSALGLYLGYQLGGLTHSNNGPSYIGGSNGSPQYSVVHHYYHGDRPIIQDGKVEADAMKKCDNVTFCTANTTPLCMNNGTVYCVATLESTIICNENSTELKCINSTVTLPCDGNSTNCNGTALNTTAISIPCVTTIDVFGDFTTGKLLVNKLSKRAADSDVTTTMESVTTTPADTNSTTTTIANNNNGTSTNSTTTPVPPIASMAQTANNPSTSITSQGISNKYCVTVIAEPIKEPIIPPNLSNEEFVKYVKTNDAMKMEADKKASHIFDIIQNYLFF